MHIFIFAFECCFNEKIDRVQAILNMWLDSALALKGIGLLWVREIWSLNLGPEIILASRLGVFRLAWQQQPRLGCTSHHLCLHLKCPPSLSAEHH